MKIRVFSDSHGSAYKMEEAVRAENPDFVFFLGDGEGDLHVLTNAFPQLPVQAVRGNCDLYSSLPAERLCVLGGFRFFLTHGHHYGVKYERDFHSLAEQARANGAQAALPRGAISMFSTGRERMTVNSSSTSSILRTRLSS